MLQSFSVAKKQVLLGPLLQSLSHVHTWYKITGREIWVRDTREWQKGTSHYSYDTMKYYCCIYHLCCAEIDGGTHMCFHKGHQKELNCENPTFLTGWNCKYKVAPDPHCVRVTAGCLGLNPGNTVVLTADWNEQLERFYLPFGGGVHLLAFPQPRGSIRSSQLSLSATGPALLKIDFYPSELDEKGKTFAFQ